MYGLYFLISFFLSVILTYFCIKLAKRYNIVDIPNDRKIHKEPVPYLGGIAIFLSFIITVLIGLKLSPFFNLMKDMQGLLISGTIIFLLGLLDDIKGTNAVLKFLVQIVAALILVKFGYIIDRITNPFGGSLIFPYWLSIIITVFWVIGIINAINLLDGLDGLASGVIGISSLFVFIIAILYHNIAV